MNALERTFISLDWMTLTLCFVLILITLAKYLFQNKFVNFIVLPFNNKYLIVYGKKSSWFDGFHILMTFFQIVNLALFIFLALDTFTEILAEQRLPLFFTLLICVFVFHLLKVSLQMGKGFVFNTQKLINELIYTKQTYFNHSSMVLFGSNILLIYVIEQSKTLIYVTILLFILINAIGLAKLLKNYQKEFLGHLFYFILYLCTLEIAPLVLIGGYLKG
ncbi:MAG: DUF4271 domain-containing protein [Bacteroidota bacterium]